MQAGNWQELLFVSAEAQMCNRQLACRKVWRRAVALSDELIAYTLQAVCSN